MRTLNELDRGAQRDAARIDFLASRIPADTIGAELGVYKGRFSRRLVDTLRPQLLHLVDPWWLLGQTHWDWGKQDSSVFDAYVQVIRSFEKELLAGTVIVHVAFDTDLLATFPDHYLDWAYLDSSHKRSQTYRELKLLHRKVKKDGVICGDDWHADAEHKHHGVSQAVTNFIDRYPYRLDGVCEQSYQWCIRRA